MVFKQPTEKEFAQVNLMAEDFWLDNEDMQPEQFRVLSDDGKVIAFGRLRRHTGATELCTMGVAKEFRKQGFGDKMVRHLQSIAGEDVYLVTILPGFFAKLDFVKVNEYPKPLQRKVEICTKEYHVDEPYFVMRWEKKAGF